MDTQKNELGNQITELLKSIHTLRDGIVVRAHLFNMEAKQTWEKLQPRVFEAEQLANKATKEARAAMTDIADALKLFQRKTKS